MPTRRSESKLLNTSMEETIPAWIEHWATCQPRASAILAPGRSTLTYYQLQEKVLRLVGRLNRTNLSRNDRVAVIFTKGIDLTLALLGTSSCVACAPVNPGLQTRELSSYLELIKATALLLPGSGMEAARDVAHSLDLPVITFEASDGEDSILSTSTDPLDPLKVGDPAAANDIAFLLPTSGTTSTPKIVAISHASACADAGNVIRCLELDVGDRCLNVMPLFHVHALFAGLLASLLAGGSFVSTPGFSAKQFFSWVDEFRPTWYSAAPTIHQAVVDNANDPRNQSIVQHHGLRLVRSAAASLPTQLFKKLETTLGVPVIETYGMTEVRTFITCNPLPPRQRKLGSVGVAVGLELGIMGANHQLLSAGECGEIVVRGKGHIRGYESEESANTGALADGWFRTGDEGKLDDEGYLFVTGRIKEIIIRGGMNVSPLEVEQALLRHAEISEAVVFPTPHRTLGQDIAAAVVPQTGSVLQETAIRAYAFLHLAEFKVPSQVVVMDHIPRSATGKLKRLMMAELLQAKLTPPRIAGGNSNELALAEIFCKVLGIPSISIKDNFFAIGGDSLRGTQVVNRVNDRFGLELSPGILFRYPTVSELACEIQKEQSDATPRDS